MCIQFSIVDRRVRFLPAVYHSERIMLFRGELLTLRRNISDLWRMSFPSWGTNFYSCQVQESVFLTFKLKPQPASLKGCCLALGSSFSTLRDLHCVSHPLIAFSQHVLPQRLILRSTSMSQRVTMKALLVRTPTLLACVETYQKEFKVASGRSGSRNSNFLCCIYLILGSVVLFDCIFYYWLQLWGAGSVVFSFPTLGAEVLLSGFPWKHFQTLW